MRTKFTFTLFVLLIIGSSFSLFAQDDCAIDLGEDISIPVGECTMLSASLDILAYSSSADTSSYIILQDVCLPEPSTPIATGIVSDDNYTGIINISFSFIFFGEEHSKLLIGDNGIITFNLEEAGGYCPWAPRCSNDT